MSSEIEHVFICHIFRGNNNIVKSWMLEPDILDLDPNSSGRSWASYCFVARWQNRDNDHTYLMRMLWVDMWESLTAVSSLNQDDDLVVIQHQADMLSTIQRTRLHKISDYIIERLMVLISLIWEDWDGKMLEVGEPSLFFSISLIHSCYPLPIQKITLAQGSDGGWGTNYQTCNILFF